MGIPTTPTALASEPLRILHLEDNDRDAELVRALLEQEGLPIRLQRVATREDFERALRSGQFDLVLSDASLPGFDGMTALHLVRSSIEDMPFVFVSGTIGEEVAIESLKRGATDYVLKHRPERLMPAVKRALHEAEERRKRKIAEARIREQAVLIEQASDAIIVRDLEDRILFWNNGAERLYGWTREEVVGRRAGELFPFNATPEFQEASRLTLEQGKWQGELRQSTKTGQEICVESRRTLLRDEAGRPRSVLVINTDITDRKRLESQLLRVQRLESIGTLAGGIAHDLNNILAPILMASQMLKMEKTDPQEIHWLDIIEHAAQRGADLVKQILAFARGSQGERVVVQIRHLLRDLVGVMRQTFPRSIAVECHTAEGLWPVSGDPSQIDQVVMNLCVNARDAMPDGGRLEIRAENFLVDDAFARMHVEARPGPYVVLTVTDTGVGIPPAVIERIFDPFFTTKEEGKGTGLGLSTVLGIVKSHGGFVTVYSEPGRGATFRVYLPAAESGVAPETEQPSAAHAGRGELILVVDDEPAIRDVTQTMLERNGYRVLTAADGADAIAIFVQHPGQVRAVITDMAMPIMDGPATISALRRLDARVPVLCVSGLLDNPRLMDETQFPHVHFLRKPFTTGALLQTLHDALRAGKTGAPAG